MLSILFSSSANNYEGLVATYAWFDNYLIRHFRNGIMIFKCKER